MKLFSRTLANEKDEWQRQLRDDRTRRIIASGKTEIPRSSLAVGPRWLEDERDGSFYRVYPNADPAYSDHCPAFYFDEAGNAVLLQRAEPASRTELEAKREARVARRAARDAEAKERRARIRAGTP